MSGTALSKALRNLEQRLGITLLLRTTRSVRLTEAGERFYAASRQALDGLQAAAEVVGEPGDKPRGTIRLNISAGADGFLRGTRWWVSSGTTRRFISTSSSTRT